MVGEDGQLPLPWLDAPLGRALAQPGHALLLVASPGLGAFELATSLAQGWLCESRPVGAPPGLPCGRCASCRLVQARTHPDLKQLLPEAQRHERGWVAGDETDANGGKRKPSKWIRIREVRDAIAWMAVTASRGRAKLLLLHPAEALQWEAASALLKTLEEPPAGARLVLTCSDPEHLLPTVRSRCQRLAMDPPPAALAIAWLAGQGVQRPEILLAAASGRPLEALAMHRADLSAESWLGLPAALAQGQAAAWQGWPLPRALDALHKLCHDLCAHAVGGAPVYFPAEALPARPPRLEPLLDWAEALRRASRHADHPWQEPLLMESLVARGRLALATLPA